MINKFTSFIAGSRTLALAAATAGLLTFGSSVKAANPYVWTGTTSTNPTISANWVSNDVPAWGSTIASTGAAFDVVNGNNNTLTYTASQGTTIFGDYLYVGNGSIEAGVANFGSFNMTGGALSFGNTTNGGGNQNAIGVNGTSPDALVMSGGTLNFLNGNTSDQSSLWIGNAANASFALSGGAVNLQNGLIMARGGANGSLSISGGTFTVGGSLGTVSDTASSAGYAWITLSGSGSFVETASSTLSLNSGFVNFQVSSGPSGSLSLFNATAATFSNMVSSSVIKINGAKATMTNFSFSTVGSQGVLTAISAPPAPITIMPLGDSITKGAIFGGSTSQSGYRDQLYTDLKGEGANFQFVGVTTSYASPQLIAAGDQYHDGFGSYALSDIYNNLASVALPGHGGDTNVGGYWMTGGGGTLRQAITPDVVLLMGGINDFYYGGSLSTVETNMSNILNWFASNRPNTMMLVGDITPFNPAMSGVASTNVARYTGYNTNIPLYNAWLSNNISSFGSNFHVVDTYDPFLSSGAPNTNLYSTDGIHPNAAGYVVLGNAWNQALVVNGVPEPSTWAMLLLGFTAVIVCGRRRHSTAARAPSEASS